MIVAGDVPLELRYDDIIVVVLLRGTVVRVVRETNLITIEPDDVVLHFAPPAFHATTFVIWAPLLDEAAFAIPRPGPIALDDLGGEIARLGVTTLWLIAPLFRMMLEMELLAFTGLRNQLTGKDVVPAEHAKRFVPTLDRRMRRGNRDWKARTRTELLRKTLSHESNDHRS